MIIENINGITILYAEGSNKITNAERTFFTDMIYLGISDSADNYYEVSKDIWKNYTGILPSNDLETINKEIDDLKRTIKELTTMLKK